MTETIPAPDLNIPDSQRTVDVSIINTTGSIRGISTRLFLTPPIKGHDWMAAPVFSYLIHHPTLNRTVLFDLGIRKDWQNLSPPLLSRFKVLGWELHVTKDVSDILKEAGVNTNNIEAIIQSHYHFDHSGNPATFGPNTALIVGPGYKGLLPGYPTNPDSPILESDHANRELIELDFDSGQSGSHTFKPLSIGRFRALDYFGDGSLYLLDTPGHTVGHISALARVTANPASFILFAGDVIHHAGELRPSKYCPLPESLIPDPFTPDPHPLDSHYGCPGAVFESLFAPRGRSPTEPFYAPPRLKNKEENFHDDVYELIRTLGKLQDADAHQNVLVAAAHDEALLDHVEFFPRGNMNEFLEKGWVRRVHWRFLRDFRKAVGKEDHDMMRREWGPERKGGNE